ncbi:GntR family transcriptional regulator [Streptococcus ovuberis]|uniref:GntR family transcriptional regulator n=1 Tax=Streptococcus ovuberis TaxID=1936207 RepID=A0A7X6N1U4_9STRE|nr:GntR family transcriptional regulator [Streptococcus ovuberis]NKZ20559.1 GntR family transcriptional regulator [Streptococcus ovuberis]
MPNNELDSKLKKLKHVQVYNQIFKLIQDGIYTPGMQLPSEPELAEQLNVSRATLRKSLALLQEDHLVKNVRGKGNFIRDFSDSDSKLGLEYLQHPIKACMSLDILETELEFRLEVPSVAVASSLKHETPVVVIADRWYHTENGPSAYSLSFVPIEIISDLEMTLHDTGELKHLLEHRLYQSDIANHSQNDFVYTQSGNFSATKYTLSNHDRFILIQENVYNKEKLIVSSKHYIPIEYFEFSITSRRSNHQ